MTTMDDVRSFIAELTDTDDLYRIRNMAEEKAATIEKDSFADQLMATLVKLESEEELDAPASTVRRVVFGTWEWDNGYFFNPHEAEVVFQSGRKQTSVDLDGLATAIDEMGAVARAANGGLGRYSRLTVEFPSKKIEY